jgi:hypothetical protein
MRPLASLVAFVCLGCGACSAGISPQLDASTEAGEVANVNVSADAEAGGSGRAIVDEDVTVQVDPTVGYAGALCFSDAACHCAVIRASDYDQSCTTDSDCMAVTEGNSCRPCFACPNAAINGRDLDRYQSDVAAATTVVNTCDCFAPLACCHAGRCGVRGQAAQCIE